MDWGTRPADDGLCMLACMTRRLRASRDQVLAFRRTTGLLDERLPAGEASVQRAAWAGLQDSAPRAALLSVHARVEGAVSSLHELTSLVQVWGPHFSVYAVAARDLAVFSLGLLPMSGRGLARAETTAKQLGHFLDGRRMAFGEAGHAMGVMPNSLRYAAATGTVLLHWDGARQPVVWTVPPPSMEPAKARAELLRRFLHIYGPTTASSFARWSGMPVSEAHSVWNGLAGEFVPVETPLGEAWLLPEDEQALREAREGGAPARLLPSGDPFYLAWGADRALLVPDADHRAELWTPRVWPGAVLVGGLIAGVWRRSDNRVSISMWRKLSRQEKEAVEAEALSLPLPRLRRPMCIEWG